LNHGHLVALAPIEELLAGSQGNVYSLVIEGDAGQILDRVRSQAWVSDIAVETDNGEATWQVAVTDEAAAKDRLLRLVLTEEQITVTHFGRKTYQLEEIFMNIVEGDDHE